jgi:hypothetical protein
MGGVPVSDSGTDDAIARARKRVERLARAQCTPGEIAASLWASHLVPDRVHAQQMVREHAEDIAAWRLAGRADVRLTAYDVATTPSDKPGQASTMSNWAKQHLGWDKQGMDPGKQGQAEKREGAAAVGLKAV